MNILLLDNYDSFTYNLRHHLEELGVNVSVRFNDDIDFEEVNQFDRIVLSPGPGLPEEAGLLISIIKEFAGNKPILGICLGLQAIAAVYGGSLLNLAKVYHGVATEVRITKQDKLFDSIDSSFVAGRYHSWVVNKQTLPDCLEILAVDDTGNIMAIRHNEYNICGVQFHPESILTPSGKQLLRNWLTV